MLQKINSLNELLKKQKIKKTLVLAVANDQHSLEAVYQAAHLCIIQGILVGKKKEIENIAHSLNLDLAGFEIIDEPDTLKAVEISIKMVHDGKAGILMKGNVATGVLLRGVLNKEWGLRKGELLSHIALFELETYHKLLAVTDAAMNIAPKLNEKVTILNNAVDFMHSLEVTNPKVAVITAVETVNDNMPATLEAALLSKMAQRNQIKRCIIDGPLALDNALSRESAEHKGIISDVAGDADVLLMPDIEAGNVLYKSLTYCAKAKVAAIIAGARAPIVLTSRSDSEESKLNSILLAAVS